MTEIHRKGNCLDLQYRILLYFEELKKYEQELKNREISMCSQDPVSADVKLSLALTRQYHRAVGVPSICCDYH